MIQQKISIFINLYKRKNYKYLGVRKLIELMEKEWWKTTERTHNFEIPSYYVSKWEDELNNNKET